MTFPPQSVIAAVPLKANERRDPPDLKRAETVEKGHGRIETRRIAVRTKLPSRLDQDWPGITAICRIERRREHWTMIDGHHLMRPQFSPRFSAFQNRALIRRR